MEDMRRNSLPNFNYRDLYEEAMLLPIEMIWAPTWRMVTFSAEELGSMSINKFIGITLGIYQMVFGISMIYARS